MLLRVRCYALMNYENLKLKTIGDGLHIFGDFSLLLLRRWPCRQKRGSSFFRWFYQWQFLER